MIFIRGGMQEHQTWQKDVSPCLTEAMGMGGGHIPIIMEFEMTKQICRNCKLINDCNIDKEKRKAAWHGSWDEWTCGMWQEDEERQVSWDDILHQSNKR